MCTYVTLFGGNIWGEMSYDNLNFGAYLFPKEERRGIGRERRPWETLKIWGGIGNSSCPYGHQMLCGEGTLAIVTVINYHHPASLLLLKFSTGPESWGLVAKPSKPGLSSPRVEGRAEETGRHSGRRENHQTDTIVVVPGKNRVHCHAPLGAWLTGQCPFVTH